MIAWDQWHTLLAVFRHGTYATAAKALRIDSTTVGRRLKQLEREVGYELFVRENERLHPTSRCEELLTHIETAAEALRGAEQQSAVDELGAVWRELRITAPPFVVTNLLAPSMDRLTKNLRIKVELIATASKAFLARREADIAIRIDDGPGVTKFDTARIEAEQIGSLEYGIYCAPGRDPESLPWAGLIERYSRSSGSETMLELAGPSGLRYQAHQFETIQKIAASGVARALLPRFIADADPGLTPIGDTILEQPLWMLFHRQDRDILHLKSARAWIKDLTGEWP
ncbi:LysR family transcriptional regulator [Pelagibius sp. Alg239-R121]|uniref:LysR family transcriptional regulator n=1 Tax=Pelagibius sp. Alg239-R121 TaxID=2993448 RepID=UPI0024A62DB4|nr:LysR family transcriptional regulator [Pelagibius sp. Alg239-R121]